METKTLRASVKRVKRRTKYDVPTTEMSTKRFDETYPRTQLRISKDEMEVIKKAAEIQAILQGRKGKRISVGAFFKNAAKADALRTIELYGHLLNDRAA